MARMEETEDDAHTLLINALRNQLNDLGTQVTQLNSKLVSSYNRISDLEDDLHESRDSLFSANGRLKDLEEKVGSHQNALLTGSLVSREEITTELSRVMERATEEASQRGLAEEAKDSIEREIGDLSESLFAEANKMVLAAKEEQSESERRMREMEKEVRMAESAVVALQTQLKEKINLAQACEEELSSKGDQVQIRKPLMNEHISPYTQFLALLDHIRSQKLTTNAIVPNLSSLLSLPFIARIVSEDSDPTLRLETAPSLNWITRRTLLNAIYTGQLDISPTPFASSLYNLSSSGSNCALCGITIQHPSSPGGAPDQLHTFRLPSTTASFPGANSALSNASSFTSGSGTVYLLCSSGYCLQRLRTTITLWSFMRSNVIDHVWRIAPIFSLPIHSPNTPTLGNDIPPMPPKKKSMLQNLPSNPAKSFSVGKLGGLWGALKRTSSVGNMDENKKQETESVDKLSLKETVNSSPPSPLSEKPSQSLVPLVQTPPLPERQTQPPVQVEVSPSSSRSLAVPDSHPDNSQPTALNGLDPSQETSQVATLAPPIHPRTRGRSGTVSVPHLPVVTEPVVEKRADEIKEEKEKEKDSAGQIEESKADIVLEDKVDETMADEVKVTESDKQKIERVPEEALGAPIVNVSKDNDGVSKETTEQATPNIQPEEKNAYKEGPSNRDANIDPPVISETPNPTPPGIKSTSSPATNTPPPVPRRPARRAVPRPPSRPNSPSTAINRGKRGSTGSNASRRTSLAISDSRKSSSVERVHEIETLTIRSEGVEKQTIRPEEVEKQESKGEVKVQQAGPEQVASAENARKEDVVPSLPVSDTTHTDQVTEVTSKDSEIASPPVKVQSSSNHTENAPVINGESEKAIETDIHSKVKDLEPTGEDLVAQHGASIEPEPNRDADVITSNLEHPANSTTQPTLVTSQLVPPPLPSKPRPKSVITFTNGTNSKTGQHSSEGSWEQKTYQEIVRLRLEMFWARIGVDCEQTGEFNLEPDL